MYRTVLYLSLIGFVISGLGLAMPESSSLLTFLLPGGISAVAGLVVSACLLHFGVAGFLRQPVYKRGLGIIGAVLVGFAFFGIANPTYGGLLPDFVRPANLFVLLAVGVAALLAAFELERPTLAEQMGLTSESLSPHSLYSLGILYIGLVLSTAKTWLVSHAVPHRLSKAQ